MPFGQPLIVKKLAIRVIGGDGQIQSGESLTTIFQLRLQEAEGAPLYQEAVDFETFVAEQRESYQQFWAASDIEITGDQKNYKRGIRFNLFPPESGAGRDGRTNFSAKGFDR